MLIRHMDWTSFYILIVIVYLLWYTVNILRDLLLSGGAASAGDNIVHYDISDLVDAQEPVDVDSDIFMAEDPLNRAMDPAVELQGESGQETEEIIILSEPPERQGVPLEEFLKQASKRAAEVANTIDF